ncbi:MAG TPA: PAS domain S-box protein, partial [Vicinamibacterales bacterium]
MSCQLDERCAQILGYESGGQAPVSWAEMRRHVHPDEWSRIEAAHEHLTNAGVDEFEDEYRCLRADGDSIWVAVLGRVVERGEGGAVRVLGAAFDITARKEAEALLSAEIEFNRTLINASPAFFVAFKDDGTIISVNDAFLSATGYRNEEVVGAEFISLFTPPEAQEVARRARADVTASVETTIVESPVSTRAGEQLMVEWHARRVLLPVGQRPFNFAVGLDVTRRKRDEMELLRHLGVLDALHETAVDLLRHRPLEEMLDTIVRRASTLFGGTEALLAMYEPELKALRVIAAIGAAQELIGREIQPGQSVAGVVFQTEEPMVLDDYQTWPHARFIGVLEMIGAVCVPVRGDGAVTGALMLGYGDRERRFTPQDVEVLTRFAQLAALVVDHARLLAEAEREIADRMRAEAEILRLNSSLEETVRLRTAELRAEINERIRAETELRERSTQLSIVNLELAAAAKLKDEFLANMSHELRTPLNAILGMAEILEERVHGEINERQLRSVKLIEESGRHLLELINEILDLAKIESGTVELKIEAVTIRQACESSVRMLREAAQRKRIQLNLVIENALQAVDADARRLKQMLVNLLSNAVKFTPEGGRVDLTAR